MLLYNNTESRVKNFFLSPKAMLYAIIKSAQWYRICKMSKEEMETFFTINVFNITGMLFKPTRKLDNTTYTSSYDGILFIKSKFVGKVMCEEIQLFEGCQFGMLNTSSYEQICPYLHTIRKHVSKLGKNIGGLNYKGKE